MIPKQKIIELLRANKTPGICEHFFFTDGFGDKATLIVEWDTYAWAPNGRRGMWRVDYRGKGHYDPPMWFSSDEEAADHLARNKVYGVKGYWRVP